MFNATYGVPYDLEEFIKYFGVMFVSVFIFASFTSVLFLILRGFGLYNMCKKQNIKNGWLSYIPITAEYIMGKISASYIKKDGRKSADLTIPLLILSILTAICFAVLIVVGCGMTVSIGSFALKAAQNDTQMTIDMFSSFIPFIIVYLITCAVAIAQTVIYYIALWRIFAIYDYNNATIFLILSIFFGFLAPIFIFIIRNYEPKATFMERLAVDIAPENNG